MASKVSKSYYDTDPVKDYCIQHSTPLHPVQKKLIEETLQHTRVSSHTSHFSYTQLACLLVSDDGGSGGDLPQRAPDKKPGRQESD